MIRKVGYKLGKGFSIVPRRNPIDGSVLLGDDNQELIDSDFVGLRDRYQAFRLNTKAVSKWATWTGAHFSDISLHPAIDMKPRRATPKAVEHRRRITSVKHITVGEVADVVSAKIDLTDPAHACREWRLVEGSSIRAVEGTVVPSAPQRAWEIVDAKQKQVFKVRDNDIVVGLVRPERRNVGLVIDAGGDLVATPEGVALVRMKKNKFGITQEYLFYLLRSETARIQLWTESGGTSYGKLGDGHIKDVIFIAPSTSDIADISKSISSWADSIRAAAKIWCKIGSEKDRVPIINSPMFGLEPEV